MDIRARQLWSNKGSNTGKEQEELNSCDNTSFGSFISAPSFPSAMSGRFFGGPSIGEDGHIQKTFILDKNQPLLTEDNSASTYFAQSFPGGCQQACANIASKFAAAAGRIHIEICKCADPSASHADSDDTEEAHFDTHMSGFWIEGARFVTCAHFLDIHQTSEDQKINTVANLKESSKTNRMKAVVSSGNKVPTRIHQAENAVPVYLLKLDRVNDLAIFKLYDDHVHQPASVLRNDIGNQAHHDKSQGLFTIGYYSADISLEGITTEDQQILHKFWPNVKPASYFPVKYTGVTQKRDDTVKFKQIFEYPNRRTISMGRLGDVLSEHQLSNFMLCDMSAWFGGSGGMVGGFVRDSSSSEGWKPVIFGVLRGDEGRQNVVATFTVKGQDWLFN